MAESPEPDAKERRPPPSRPGTAGPPFSTPRADENTRPPPGLEPEQRPATRWWSFRRERQGAYDLVVMGAILALVAILFVALVTGWWW